MIYILIGESGSGKTTLAEWMVAEQLVSHQILSHTSRMRRPNEGMTYIFSDRGDFDPAIAFEYTEFGGNYYWTNTSDFNIVGDAVIILDAIGANKIRSIRRDTRIIYIKCDSVERANRVGWDRMSRDTGMFRMFPCDYVVDNSEDIELTKDFIRKIVQQ